MEGVKSEALNLFYTNSRILIGGYSGSGKSVLVGKIVAKYNNSFKNIIISSPSESFPVNNNSKIIYHNGVNAFDPFSTTESLEGRTLIIYDDCMLESHSEKTIATVFARGRHKNISAMFITQNIYYPSKFHRSIALNCTHFLLLKMRDISQIQYFGRTFLEKDKVREFVAIYKKYVENRLYGYILIDFTTPSTSKLMIRTNIVDAQYEKTIVIN